MRVSRGDLARLRFELRDHIDPKTNYLEGRELDLGQRVRLSMLATVVVSPSGNLIFGEFASDVTHE